MGWRTRRYGPLVAQGERDLVERFEQTFACEVVELERIAAGRPRLEVDRQLLARSRALHQVSHLLLGELHGEQSDLQRVLAEDVAERRRDHRLEAVILERPWGVLARRPAAEIAPGEQDLPLLVVQLEVRVLAPVEEEKLAEAGALDALEELLRDDLVGVDVRAVEHDRARRHHPEGPHAGTAKWPSSAVAAATSGLTRCV